MSKRVAASVLIASALIACGAESARDTTVGGGIATFAPPASPTRAPLIGTVVKAGSPTAPGDEGPGTVKIHAAGTNADDPRTEPHPCVFSVVGFGFDPAATGTYSIKSWPPSDPSGVLVAEGTWGPADPAGGWQTQLLTLPDGHYKLFVEQLVPPAPGGAKQKTFWVECGPPPVIPETPAAALLPLSAAVLLGIVFFALRKRQARHA